MQDITGYELLDKDIAIIREFFDYDEQQKIIEGISEHFNVLDERGNYNCPDYEDRRRGRCYNKFKDSPTLITANSQKMINSMSSNNTAFKCTGFTHTLLNVYPGETGMGWHQDGVGDSDGDDNEPVYTLSLGNTALFLYRNTHKRVRSITLYSGDLLVFGGSKRRMEHCVKRVHTGTHPANVRYNLTFRTCSNLSDEKFLAAQTDAYNRRRSLKFEQRRKDRLLVQ